MINEKFFPTILILCCIGAAIMYIPTSDWRKVFYWFGAALINICVTY
jgi:hypothetical protein